MRCRKTAIPMATAPQMTTTGGICNPKVVPVAVVSLVRNGGALPVSCPWVHATTAPALIAPMPRVTINGWMRQRWQIQPVAPPSDAAPMTARAMAGGALQPCLP